MQELEERIVSRKQVYAGVILDVEHWQVQLPNGEPALREVIIHHGAAAVVPIDEAGNIVLVQQFRPAAGRVTTELPAGKLDSPQEDMLTCARRELMEETGLAADTLRLLTVLDTTPAICTERIGIYLATGLRQGETCPDADEFLGIIRMPLTEAAERVMAGEFRDAKTIAGILMAKHLLG